MELKKLIGIIPIIGGILALIGTYVPLTMISSGSTIISMEIWITPLGEITGDLWYGLFLDFCRLGGLADLSSQAMIPIVFGYIIVGIAVAAIALGAMQLIVPKENKIVIINLILGIALIVLVIILNLIIGSIPSALVSDPLVFMIGYLGIKPELLNAIIMLSGVATSAAGGFYYILIGGILILIIELVIMLQMRSETA
jgi:hypothetical protein